MTKFIEILEKQELIEKLRQNGFADLIEAFLLNENKIFTRRGRLNKSGACRVLGVKVKQLEATMERCRETLINKPIDEATDEDQLL